MAGPQHETSHGSNATYLEDDLFLRLQFWSNSSAACSLALSKPGVSVAVSYRTDPDRDNWILLEPLTATTLDSSCKRLAYILCNVHVYQSFSSFETLLHNTSEVYNTVGSIGIQTRQTC